MFGWISSFTSIVTMLYALYQSELFRNLVDAAKKIVNSPELQRLFNELIELFSERREGLVFERTYQEERFAPFREQTGLSAEAASTLVWAAGLAQRNPAPGNIDLPTKAEEMVAAAHLPALSGPPLGQYYDPANEQPGLKPEKETMNKGFTDPQNRSTKFNPDDSDNVDPKNVEASMPTKLEDSQRKDAQDDKDQTLGKGDPTGQAKPQPKVADMDPKNQKAAQEASKSAPHPKATAPTQQRHTTPVDPKKSDKK